MNRGPSRSPKALWSVWRGAMGICRSGKRFCSVPRVSAALDQRRKTHASSMRLPDPTHSRLLQIRKLLQRIQVSIHLLRAPHRRSRWQHKHLLSRATESITWLEQRRYLLRSSFGISYGVERETGASFRSGDREDPEGPTAIPTSTLHIARLNTARMHSAAPSARDLCGSGSGGSRTPANFRTSLRLCFPVTSEQTIRRSGFRVSR